MLLQQNPGNGSMEKMKVKSLTWLNYIWMKQVTVKDRMENEATKTGDLKYKLNGKVKQSIMR